MGIGSWGRPRRGRSTLDIYTITIGREDYLPCQLAKLLENRSGFRQHIFVQNGCQASPGVRRLLKKLGSQVLTTEPLAVGSCIDAVKKHFGGTHTLKLDDDALPVGDRFFEHLNALISLIPDRVFSPFPVGLTRTHRGPRRIEGRSLEVVYSPRTDTYYTLRPVKQVGGFARVAPTEYYGMLSFTPDLHKEDSEFSQAMRDAQVPMCYLENGLIVEHAETVWGQKRRNPGYFKQRKALMNMREAEASICNQ